MNQNYFDIGGFLDQLKDRKIAITAEMYGKILSSLNQLVDKTDNASQIKTIIGVIVAKNAQELKLIKETELKTIAIEENSPPPTEDNSNNSTATVPLKKRIRWDLIGLAISLLIILSIFVWLNDREEDLKMLLPQISKMQKDWQTINFQVQNLQDSSDTIIWHFGDGHADSLNTDTVTHRYPDKGFFKVTAAIASLDTVIKDSVQIAQNPDCQLIITEKTIFPQCKTTIFKKEEKTNCSYLLSIKYTSSANEYHIFWDDSSLCTVEKRDSAKHLYKKSGFYQLRIVPIEAGSSCDTVRTEVFISNPEAERIYPIANYLSLQKIPDAYYFVPNNNISNLLLLLIGVIMLFFLFRYGFLWGFPFGGKKNTLNTEAPFTITYQNQNPSIRVSKNVDTWAVELLKRGVGQIEKIDVLKSVNKTIRYAGLPYIEKSKPKQKTCYLILIDDYSVYRQQAQYYQFITETLKDRMIDLETFFYHADPRICWNEKYPDGVSIDELYMKFGTYNLIMITEGEKLIDYSSGSIYQWIYDALSLWHNKAIFTPVVSKNWHYVEKLLSRFFLILPANPKGQLLLKNYLIKEQKPSYEEIKTALNERVNEQPYQLFEKPLDDLTIEDVKDYLDEKISDKPVIRNEDSKNDLLLQWALATTIYPYSNWEITLAIGKAIEQKYGEKNLVTTTNLVKISALPWLKQKKLSDALRVKLLASLNPEIEQIARRKVVEMLEGLSIPPESRAFNEKEMLEGQQWIAIKAQSPEEKLKKDESFRKLTTYYKNNVLIDKITEEKLKQKERKWFYLFAVMWFLFAGIYLLFSFYETRIQKKFTTDEIKSEYLKPFFEKKAKADKTTEFNNQAVDIWNGSSAKSGNLKVETYSKAITLLRKADSLNADTTVLLNLKRMDYNLRVLAFQQRNLFNDDAWNSLKEEDEFERHYLSYAGFFDIDSTSEITDSLLKNVINDIVWLVTDTTNDIKGFKAYSNIAPGILFGLFQSPTYQIGGKIVRDVRSKKDTIYTEFKEIPFYESDSKKVLLKDSTYVKKVLEVELLKLNLYNEVETVVEEAKVQIIRVTPRFLNVVDTIDKRLVGSPTIISSNTPAKNFDKIAYLSPYTIDSVPPVIAAYEPLNTGIKNYSLVVGTLGGITFSPDRQFLYLEVLVNKYPYRAAINLQNINNPKDEVIASVVDNYKSALWFNAPATESGLYKVEKKTESTALDYLERNLLSQSKTISVNELINRLQQEKNLNVRIFIWGEEYTNQNGTEEIINVHLNQGTTDARFQSENGIYQDGGIMIEETDPKASRGKGGKSTNSPSGKYRFYLIRFSSQRYPTDDNGNYLSPESGKRKN